MVLPSPSFNSQTLQWKALKLGKEVLAQRAPGIISGTESSQHARYYLIKVLDLKTIISRRVNIKHQDFLVDGIVSRKQVEAILAKICGTGKFLDSSFSRKKHQQILSFVFKDESNLHNVWVISCEPILFLPTSSCLLKLCQA